VLDSFERLASDVAGQLIVLGCIRSKAWALYTQFGIENTDGGLSTQNVKFSLLSRFTLRINDKYH
jgi:hypothetical protein